MLNTAAKISGYCTLPLSLITFYASGWSTPKAEDKSNCRCLHTVDGQLDSYLFDHLRRGSLHQRNQNMNERDYAPGTLIKSHPLPPQAEVSNTWKYA